jgi:hypothetical protein
MSGKSSVNLSEEHRIFEYRVLSRRPGTKKEDEMEARERGVLLGCEISTV